jgi:8-oxo-dGTP pyrophosphatase MutT (NUDIX family)
MADAASTPHPAATLILIRDSDRGAEILLVRRSAGLSFHGGAWVFPGGRIDDEDRRAAGDAGDVREAARRAAVREAREEAGVAIDGASLFLLSRWITPVGLPKRFDTWYFAAPAGIDAVRVDGGEIDDHRWMLAEEALAAQSRSEIELPPPTFVTLTQLRDERRAGDVLETLRRRPFQCYEPRLVIIPGGACTLYAGDAGYDTGDVECSGRRHRLWMLDSGWRYDCSEAD